MSDPQKLDLARVALYLIRATNTSPQAISHRPDYATFRGTVAAEVKTYVTPFSIGAVQSRRE
jgi:hypothetical protein